jgi:hypothetical protein
MIGNLTSLKFASVDPCPFVWDRIDQRLRGGDEEDDFGCFASLRDCSINPPLDIKSKLFAELDALQQVSYLADDHFTTKNFTGGINSLSTQKGSRVNARYYWGVAAVIALCIAACSYVVINSKIFRGASSPSVKNKENVEDNRFVPTSVSGKMSDEISF